MANSYYERINEYIPRTRALGEQVREDYSGVEAGFNKLPPHNENGTGFDESFVVKDPVQDKSPTPYKDLVRAEGKADTALKILNEIDTSEVVNKNTRELGQDVFGRQLFYGDACKVVHISGDDYRVLAGEGYVAGIRFLFAGEDIKITETPTSVWLDVSQHGDPVSDIRPVVIVVISNNDLIDYLDDDGILHYLEKISTIDANHIKDARTVFNDFKNSGYTHFDITNAKESDNRFRFFIKIANASDAVYRRAIDQTEYDKFPKDAKFTDYYDIKWILNIHSSINASWINNDEEAISLANALNIKDVTLLSGRKILIDNWNPLSEPIYARSTPNNSMMTYGANYDELGAAGRHYLWGMNCQFSNPGTAPVTAHSAVTSGFRVRSIDATTRQIGADGDAHSIEIISGQRSAKALCLCESGSNIVNLYKTEIAGSRFCVGDVVYSDSFPEGTSVTEITKNGTTVTGFEISNVSIIDGGSNYESGEVVYLARPSGDMNRYGKGVVKAVDNGEITSILITEGGDFNNRNFENLSIVYPSGNGIGGIASGNMIIAGYGNPDRIILSQSSLLNGYYTLSFRCIANNNIGLLITGSGDGGLDGDGNGNGKAITIQAYGKSAYKIGLQYSGSGIRSDGDMIRGTNLDINSIINTYSGKTNYGYRISGINILYTGFDVFNSQASTIFGISQTTANYGLKFTGSNTFTFSAIYLEGQNIGTDSIHGMKIGTNHDSKIGFWGRNPTSRPESITKPEGGDTRDGEARKSINSIINTLQSIGLIGID